MVDQHRHAHPRLVDVGEPVIERRGRTVLDTRNVFAHFARDIARGEIRRSRRDRGFGAGQLEDVVRAVTHAQPAADAGAEEIALRQGTGRAQNQGGKRL